MVGDGEEVFLIGSGGTIIRTAVNDISVQGRDASGVRVMNVNDGHQVAAVARVLATDEDDADAEDGEESGEAPVAEATESSEEE